MSKECFILFKAKSQNGTVVLLDCPENIIPKLGMLFRDKSGINWKVYGVGLPIYNSLLSKKFQTHYETDIIFNCLLKAEQHSEDLWLHDSLFYEG